MSAGITDAVLAGIVNISADAIVSVDQAQKIMFFNEGAEQIFGYSTHEILGQSLEKLIPERFRETHSAQVTGFGKSSTRARKMGERRQISGVRKNGEEFPAEAAISHVDVNGEKIYSVILRDVTDRRRADEAQRFLARAGETLVSSIGAEETLRAVARLAVPQLADACIVHSYHDDAFQGVAVAHIDPQRGRVIERSRVEHPIDYSGDHPIARGIQNRAPLVLSAANPADEASLSRSSDIFADTPSAAIILPLLAREHLLGVIGFYRENGSYGEDDLFLTEEIARRAAIALDNARLHEQVKTGVQARDDMIGIVSHDLRNPVNAVRMLTGVMLNSEGAEPISPKMVEYATVIRQAALQMDSLIMDLLDVTRVEAGRLSVDPKPIDAEELLSDALRTLSPVAEGKGLKLKLNAPDDLPLISADKDRVSQALSTLVGNAIKFSPAGTEIGVRVIVLDAEVMFSVTDAGRGMTPEQLAHAFDRFWQSSRTDRQGAGLGLAITKGIIDAHNGRIWAESAPGAGSTFYFTVPIAAP
ncbi:MAG: ATP-binding protein [Gemmatimonadaceae bacterium]